MYWKLNTESTMRPNPLSYNLVGAPVVSVEGEGRDWSDSLQVTAISRGSDHLSSPTLLPTYHVNLMSHLL